MNREKLLIFIYYFFSFLEFIEKGKYIITNYSYDMLIAHVFDPWCFLVNIDYIVEFEAYECIY